MCVLFSSQAHIKGEKLYILKGITIMLTQTELQINKILGHTKLIECFTGSLIPRPHI